MLRTNPTSFSRKHVGKGTVSLLLFLIFFNLLINIYLYRFYLNHSSAKQFVLKKEIGLYCTLFFLSHPTHNNWDSWLYLYRAYHYIHKHPHMNIYKEFYFHKGMKFQYSPMSILLMEPFRKLSLKKFIKTANYISWVGIWLSIFLLAKIFSTSLQKFPQTQAPLFGDFWSKFVLAFCFSVTYYPLMDSYRLGQIQTWIYLLFILATWMWMLDKKEIAGILIGINALIKPQFGLFLFWGLAKKEKRFVLGWSCLFFPVLFLSLCTFGLHHHVEYVKFLHYISKHGESYHPNQSINGLLYRLFHIGPNIRPGNHWYAPYRPWIHTVSYVSFFLFIIPAMFVGSTGPDKTKGLLDFSIAAVSFTLASPIAWTHHYSIMLPLFVIAFSVILNLPSNFTYMVVLAVSFVLCSNFIYLSNYLYYSSLNILQSLTFWGGVLFLLLLYKLRTEIGENPITTANRYPDSHNLDS